MAVPRAALLSIAEGRKMARVISLACFEGGTIDRPGERVWTSLRICQGTLCCSCISFNVKGNGKVHWARAVAKTGSALFLECVSCISGGIKTLLWFGWLLLAVLTSLGRNEEFYLGYSVMGCTFCWVQVTVALFALELQWSIRTENLDWSVYSVTVITCSFLCIFFFFTNYFSSGGWR